MLPWANTKEHTEFRQGQEAVDATTSTPAMPTDSVACSELFFQRCLWCGTPAYRRSFCPACGSTTFERERSAGAGVLVRRRGPARNNTWFVAMDEEFTLICKVTGTLPIGVGARVNVLRAVAPLDQGIPVVECTRLAPASLALALVTGRRLRRVTFAAPRRT
jgi:hypothetical protein